MTFLSQKCLSALATTRTCPCVRSERLYHSYVDQSDDFAMQYSRESEVEGFEALPPYKRPLKLVLSQQINRTRNISLGITILEPGWTSETGDAIWFVLSGIGQAKVSEEITQIEEGTAIYCPPAQPRQLINNGKEDMRVLCVLLKLMQADPACRQMKQVEHMRFISQASAHSNTPSVGLPCHDRRFLSRGGSDESNYASQNFRVKQYIRLPSSYGAQVEVALPKTTIIDLSLPLVSFGWEPLPVKIFRYDHAEGSRYVGGPLGLSPDDFPNKTGPAVEEMEIHSHAGTHLDAPWHYGPTVAGKPAKTIDEIPLEWCYGDGLVIDVRHRKPGEYITLDDIKNGLKKISYHLKPYDIVLIMTGGDKRWEFSDYPNASPGMSAEATEWIIDQGVKVIGIDGFGFDRPFKKMAEDFKKGEKGALWPSHHDVGRRKEYCHIEKMANLDKIPKPFGFKVACFPVKIAKAGAGWCRAVAILEQ